MKFPRDRAKLPYDEIDSDGLGKIEMSNWEAKVRKAVKGILIRELLLRIWVERSILTILKERPAKAVLKSTKTAKYLNYRLKYGII
jgi:hypothetical protein